MFARCVARRSKRVHYYAPFNKVKNIIFFKKLIAKSTSNTRFTENIFLSNHETRCTIVVTKQNG